MKFKTTTKAITKGYSKIIGLGYCVAQSLLRGRNPIAYNSGIAGWNYDVYDISDILPGTAICTGYRGMPNWAKVDYKLLSILEDSARNNPDSAEKLLREFVSATIQPN